MSTAKKKTAQNPAHESVIGAVDAATQQFSGAADMLKGGLDAALDAGAEQTRTAYAFEGVEFAGRENIDAALKAGEACFAGLKGLNDFWFKSAKDAARFNADAVKALSGCKTPEDLTQTQMKLATTGMEAAVATATAFGEVASKAAGEVSAPLNFPFDATAFTAPFAQFWNKNAA